MAKSADKQHMIKNLIALWIVYKLYIHEPIFGVGAFLMFLSYQIGKEVGLRASAAARREPGRPSEKPDQPSIVYSSSP